VGPGEVLPEDLPERFWEREPASPVIFPAKSGREKFYFDRVGPGKIFCCNRHPAKQFSGSYRFRPEKIRSDCSRRPGIFSGCRELIRRDIRAGFLQRLVYSLSVACGGVGPGLVGVGRTRGRCSTGPVVNCRNRSDFEERRHG
jgi:hypothetical protein